MDLLENTIQLALLDVIENNNEYLENCLVYQQDGAPFRYAASVRQYLGKAMPGQRIARRGVIEWPSCSPVLSQLDFLWNSSAAPTHW